jgi:hypothetical protein
LAAPKDELKTLASEVERKSSRLGEIARDAADVDEAILEKVVMTLDDACCIEVMQLIGKSRAE